MTEVLGYLLLAVVVLGVVVLIAGAIIKPAPGGE